MTALQFFLCTALPVTGMCYALIGALKIPLVERLKIDEAKVGGLLSAFGIMFGPVILAAGFLSDSLGRQIVWIGGSGMVTVALLSLSQSKSYAGAWLSVALMSTGLAAMVNVANPVMMMAFENPVTAINAGDFLFGLGAFFTPALVAFLVRRSGYSMAVALLAAAPALAMALGIMINIGGAPGTAGPGAAGAGFRGLMTDPVTWFCALTLMLWAPLESSTAAWATSFVNAQRLDEEDEARGKRIAAWTLSGFWLCFMGSRLLMALYHQFFSEGSDSVAGTRLLHIALALLALAAMFGLVRSRRRSLTIAIILAMGLISGPFVPGVIAILLSHVSPEVSGRAIGVAFAGASIGWTLVPLVIGRIAAKTDSLHRGFQMAVVTAFLLLALVATHWAYA